MGHSVNHRLAAAPRAGSKDRADHRGGAYSTTLSSIGLVLADPPCLPRRWSCDLRPERASPDYPDHLSNVPCPLPPVDRSGCMCRLLLRSTRPSPTVRRVGIHNISFEVCSGFTRVTARRIARPPEAAFVTRLRNGQLPDRPARQLPDQPTTLWVVPSSTGGPRLPGALSP